MPGVPLPVYHILPPEQLPNCASNPTASTVLVLYANYRLALQVGTVTCRVVDVTAV